MQQFDYIIVGQGICGTFLSHYLLKENKSVLVIDHNKINSASRVASGVINPVTGRRIVKTWKTDEVMPFASEAYRDISRTVNINPVIGSITVLDIHTSGQMQQAFEKRLQEPEHAYLNQCNDENKWNPYFNITFGIGEISPAYCIDLNTLMNEWRIYLRNSNSLSEDRFEENELVIKNDSVVYKNISAKKIIYCDGIASKQSRYFNHLPFAFNKGEALIVSIPDLPRNFIYKQGFSLVPWGKEDLFWIGSTYEWNYDDDLPTKDFSVKVEKHLKEHVKLSYTIVDHLASLRPANTERRPFAGLHKTFSQIGILNGMGTKCCSLAPYFAKQLAQHILYNLPIDQEADVRRFSLQPEP